jgi:hypothetical protein
MADVLAPDSPENHIAASTPSAVTCTAVETPYAQNHHRFRPAAAAITGSTNGVCILSEYHSGAAVAKVLRNVAGRLPSRKIRVKRRPNRRL